MAALDFPASPTLNQLFVAGNGVTYKWNGTLWVASGGGASISVSDTPPGSPTAGAMWWNSVLGTLMVYYNDGNSSQWVPATPTMAGSYLPLTGGTLTGPLTGTTATMSSTITTTAGDVILSGDNHSLEVKATGGVGYDWLWQGIIADGRFRLFDASAGGALEVLSVAKTTGNLQLNKPLTGTTATFSGTVTAPGHQIQMVSVETGAVASGTGAIPQDDTIPQQTEGDQYMTLAITPKSATSKLIIEVVTVLSNTIANHLTAALFQDAGANALAAAMTTISSANYIVTIAFRHVMTSGTTSATTFKVRAGTAGTGTTTFNGNVSGTRIYGGVLASSIVIREVAP